jgi:hypothetical protein
MPNNKDGESDKPHEQPQTQKPSEIQADPALERIIEEGLRPDRETRQK